MTDIKKYPHNYEEEKAYCRVCGNAIQQGSKYCPNCGADQENENLMKDVYGGPEMFESEEPKKRANEGRKMFGRVYAGPEAFEGVYAGPEMIESERQTMAALYGGPEMFESVYAGPEMFEGEENVSDQKEEPAEEPEMHALYAAPAPRKGLLSKIKDKFEK